MHRLGGQKHGELDNQLALGTNRTQIELATPGHDVVEHSIERELIIEFTVLLTAKTMHALFGPSRRRWIAL